jgi:hypothetical protein
LESGSLEMDGVLFGVKVRCQHGASRLVSTLRAFQALALSLSASVVLAD